MKNDFGLYLILTDPLAGYEACAEAAVEKKVSFLQLRMKTARPAELRQTAKALRAITRGSKTRFIVNDDLDLAMEVDADGVHLGQDDLSLTEARARWATPEKCLGLSTHTLEQARNAVELRPDYIGVGPVFPTATKPDAAPALGVEEVGRIAREIPIPSVAIGGINDRNLADVLSAGARNFCVVSAVNQSAHPREMIERLTEIWKRTLF